MQRSKILVFVVIIVNILIFVVFFKSNTNEKTKENMKRDHATEKLYQNLKKIVSDGKIMFGIANPTTLKYIDTHIYEGFDDSDCKDITGSHPAFYESDFMWHIEKPLRDADVEAMKKAHARGAVLGYCWHTRGMTSNSFYAKHNDEFTSDKDLVKKIVSDLPREENPELDWLLTEIDTLIIPVLEEIGAPIVFRPWHEMNGFWFWWGSHNCTPEEYIKLFRLTVDYMREKGVRNVLYAWSPDTKATFEYYPGDEYVDILGLDMYEPGIFEWKPIELVLEEMGKLTDYAIEHGKVAAITETGLRNHHGEVQYPESYPDFWTKYMLEPLLNDPKAHRIAWILSWYSADWGKKRENQFYIPYRGIENDRKNGQEAIDDFIRFYKHPAMLFEDNLPNMYK
jgi:mannan endo-1,4-beta-mannosidase